MENSNISSSSIVSYDKLDGLAKWLGTSVASAFFASLERCSCVNLTTSDSDSDEDNDEEAKDRPLMLTNLQTPFDSTTTMDPTSVHHLPV